MGKTYNRILIAIFILVFGGISFLSLILSDRSFSEVENRSLKMFPEISLKRLMNGKLEDDLEDYVSDQIAGRDYWFEAKAAADKTAGAEEEDGVFLLKDRLIRALDEPDEDTMATLDSSVEQVNSLAEYCKELDIPFSFALVPTAAQIWNDRLPDGAPTADEKALIEDIYGRMDDDVQTIDMLSPLSDHADEEIYYRTDHHWTSLGAYYGAQALFDAFGMAEIEEAEVERKEVSDSFYGTNRSRTGAAWIEADTIETFVDDSDVEVLVNKTGKLEAGVLYDESKLEHLNQYSYFLGGNEPLYVLSSDKENASNEKILIIRDSYSDSLAPFLTLRFGEIHLWDVRYNRTSLCEYIEEQQFDRVLVLYQNSFFLEGEGMEKLGK